VAPVVPITELQYAVALLPPLVRTCPAAPTDESTLKNVVSVVICRVVSTFDVPYVAFVGLDVGKFVHKAN
jgi:hypothetical protein